MANSHLASKKSTQKINSKTNQKIKMTTLCASIRSSTDNHLQCLMKALPNEKYCALHQNDPCVTDYQVQVCDMINDKYSRTITYPETQIINPLFRKININPYQCQSQTNFSQTTDKPTKKLKYPAKKPAMKKSTAFAMSNTFKEQHIDTIINNHQEHQEDLEIKLLILVNEEKYSSKIKDLIGPVFDDITISEDEQDPVTFDSFWEYVDGVKVPSLSNRYYLFSYIDSKGKVRCLTVFTVYNMIEQDEFIHPITMEPIPENDIARAKELIHLYHTKLSLFTDNNESDSTEYKLKNRITKLFKQFHIHSIYFEPTWLTSITDIDKLYRIIKETDKLVSNNLKIINNNLHGFKIFQKKPVPIINTRNRRSKGASKNLAEDPIMLQEYIVEEWEKLIKAADNPQNQIPIWIMASGLSFVVPEIKSKFPDLEIMI